MDEGAGMQDCVHQAAGDSSRALRAVSKETPCPEGGAAAAVDQNRFGERGNCWAACFATILGLPLNAVPDFMAAGDDEADWWNATRQWLRSRDLALVLTEDVSAGWRCDAFYIASGPSPRGVEHATVWRRGKLVHDPHPDRSGLTQVTGLAFLLPRVYTPLPPLQSQGREVPTGQSLPSEAREATSHSSGPDVVTEAADLLEALALTEPLSAAAYQDTLRLAAGLRRMGRQ